MIDYAAILTLKYKGTEWVLNGDEYEGLEWLSDSPKPTKKQLDDLWPVILSEIENEKAAKIDSKTSAINKLAALGLTEEEIKAITA
jgi:hypothetical protein